MGDLTERLERLADDGTPRGATAVMTGARQSLLVEPRPARRATRKEWRARRGLLVAAVVVLVVVIAASVVVVARDSSDPAQVLPAISDTTTYRDLYDTSDRPIDGPIYLVPDVVPDGFTVLRVDTAAGSGGSGSPEADRIESFARFDAAGERVEEYFQVQWGRGAPAIEDLPGAQARVHTDDPLAGYRGQGTSVTIRGIDGVEGGNDEWHFVAWEEPHDRMVAVSSPTLPTAELSTIAEGLAVRPEGGFEVTRAPEGFVQISSQPGMASSGSPARDVVYSDAAGRGFIVHLGEHSDYTPGSNLLPSGAPPGEKRVVDVNGHHAVVGAQLNSGLSYDQQTLFLSAADQYVQWLEPANTLVTVSAVGLSEADVLAIARGLRTVDRNDWERLLATAPGRNGAVPLDSSGPEPAFTGEEGAIADVFRLWVSGPDIDTTVSLLEDGEALRDTIGQVRAQNPDAQNHTARVDAVRLIDDTHALVTFSISTNGGGVSLLGQQGGAVKIDGTWHVNRSTYCSLISLGGTTCPPR
jgi:hypothetical protein